MKHVYLEISSGAEEHMGGNQKTRSHFCTEVSMDT